MDRRCFVLALGASAFAASLASLAQQLRIPKVGFLISETLSDETSRIEALRGGLREYGYIEGKNIAIEIRTADGKYERLPELAAELIGLKVDLVVAFGTKALSALLAATKTIPIVDPIMGDPVALGLSSDLARPGGNITGSVAFNSEANAKGLAFLKEAIPRISRVAMLVNPANAGTSLGVQNVHAAAGARKIDLQVFEVRNAGEIGGTFATMARRRIEAIVVASDTLLRANAGEIAALAAKQRLPSAGTREFVAAGGLIGYGVDSLALYRRAAYFVDRIIKGAKPDDLPIERATKLELVVNLKTAKALGLTIPQSLLLRADEVIQ